MDSKTKTEAEKPKKATKTVDPKTTEKKAKKPAVAKKPLKEAKIKKRTITLRIHFMTLEAIKLKAERAGVPYQDYIAMIIHKDAKKGF